VGENVIKGEEGGIEKEALARSEGKKVFTPSGEGKLLPHSLSLLRKKKKQEKDNRRTAADFPLSLGKKGTPQRKIDLIRRRGGKGMK